MRALLAELQVMASANSPKIRPDVDLSALLQAQAAMAGLGAAGGEAGLKAAGGAASAGPYGAIAIAVAAIAAAAPAVSIVSGALAAIPGAVAGIAAPIGAIALGLDGIKAAAAQLQQPFDQLRASVAGVFEGMLTPIFAQLGQIFPALTAGMQQVAAGLSTAFGGVVDGLTSAEGLGSLQTIFQNVAAAIGAAAPGLQAFTTGLLQMAASFSGLFPNIAETFNSLGASFGTWVTQMTTANSEGVSPLQESLKGLGSIVTSIGPVLANLFNQGLAALRDPSFIAGIQGFVTGFGQLASAVMTASQWLVKITSWFNGLQNLVSNTGALFSVLGNVISTSLQSAAGVVQGAVAAIQAAISGGFNALVGIAQGAWNAVVGAVQAGVSAAVSAASELGGQIVSALSGFAGQMVEVGRNLIMGLVDGIKAAAGAVVDAAKSVVSGAINAAKSVLGIASPSKVFHEFGLFVGEGLKNGLDASSPEATSAVQRMAEQMVAAFSAGIKDAFAKPMQDEMSAVGAAIDGTDIGGGQKVNWNDKVNQTLEDLTSMPIEFGMSNAKGVLQDFGISGGGLLGAGLDLGQSMLGSAVQFNFHVNSVDEAMSAKDRAVNQQAAAYVGR